MQITYSSEGKAPNGESFLTVKKARGYYEYSERPGKDSIAFILFDSNRDKPFGLIKESKPPMDERRGEEVKMVTAFGGSIDMDKTYQTIGQIEVVEEAGYIVPLDKIHSCGQTLVSSQMSQMCELFLVDVTDIEKTELAEYEYKDADDEFVGNATVWMDGLEVLENMDWKSIVICTKYFQ